MVEIILQVPHDAKLFFICFPRHRTAGKWNFINFAQIALHMIDGSTEDNLAISAAIYYFSYYISSLSKTPDKRELGENMDFAWMMCHAMNLGNVPMWVGFNALLHTDELPEQVVLYMKNLNMPIISLDVIQETLVTTQKCAKEVGQQYGVVTYDLNAAKPAMQMQVTDAPRYDDVFIMPGSFHVEMVFFKAIGKIIEESGGPKMLTDSDILAPGSPNGFLSGKHFNRCKRLHPMLALAFEILHFESFMEACQQNKDFLIDELVPLLRRLQENADEMTWNEVKSSDVFVSYIEKYRVYLEQTRSGTHGATAQFWIMYVDFIHDFHNLEWAIRTNDIDLFAHALTPVINLFFATNHINYSRWLSKFQLDLLNIDNNSPWATYHIRRWSIHSSEDKQILQQNPRGSDTGTNS